MIDGNKLGTVGFEKIGTPYEEMDCQAFIEWCLRQCGCNKDLAGSNAWYREVMGNGVIMSPEECVKELGCVPKGAFLFIHAFDGGEEKRGYHDGLGNASHIGICTMPNGEGAIQSSKSKGGVCEGKFKGKTINGGWNKVGLWDKVCYDYGSSSEPIPEPKPTPTDVTAIVYADNGKPVRLRKSKSTLSTRLAEIPCGDEVKVLERGDTWTKVSWSNIKGFMMTKYLIFDGEKEQLYCVEIHDLPKALADEIAGTYGGTARKEKG